MSEPMRSPSRMRSLFLSTIALCELEECKNRDIKVNKRDIHFVAHLQKGIPRKYKSGGSFDTAFDLREWFGSNGFRTYPGTLFVSNIVTAMSATVFLSPGPLVSIPNAQQI